MGYVVWTALPAQEPVSISEAKNWLRIDSGFTADDSLIQGLIQEAREHIERVTGRCLARRTGRMVLDSMPYYTDTIQSQLAYPPSYYSLPRYSTTLWNYSQMIKMFYPPIVSVQQIRFVGSDGSADTLSQDTDFILDRISQPARIFPIPGQYWPPNYYTPNSCEIDFTAGYDPSDTAGPDEHDVSLSPPQQQPDSIVLLAIPWTFKRLILAIAHHRYDNRTDDLPDKLEQAIQAEMCPDFQPTRG
ncbi:MAG: head-tail connector protein [Patescibacteria group bacterium]|nr:head-tail connector protein [Patescibacteria group bacterium]